MEFPLKLTLDDAVNDMSGTGGEKFLTNRPLTDRLIKKAKDSKKKISDSIYTFASIIHEYNEVVKEAGNARKTTHRVESPSPNIRVFLKGTVWSCFMVSQKDFMNSKNKLFSSSNVLDANCIINFSIPHSDSATNGTVIDTVGLGVDYGFRLAQFSDTGRLLIGKHLVEILTERKDEGDKDDSKLFFSCKVGESEGADKGKSLLINYIGNGELKGFNRMQPLYMGMCNIEKNRSKHDDIAQHVLQRLFPTHKLDEYNQDDDVKKYPKEIPVIGVNEEWLEERKSGDETDG